MVGKRFRFEHPNKLAAINKALNFLSIYCPKHYIRIVFRRKTILKSETVSAALSISSRLHQKYSLGTSYYMVQLIYVECQRESQHNKSEDRLIIFYLTLACISATRIIVNSTSWQKHKTEVDDTTYMMLNTSEIGSSL